MLPRVSIGELEVSCLGYGCYGVGGAYGAKDPSLWEGLIRKAFDLGITLFDVAEAYGPAEEILGRAVAPFRDQVVIASKVGVGPSGERDASRGRVLEACQASLRRLGTDRIDLYQIHFDDPKTPIAETVGALEELRSQGKIREYGVGHLPFERVKEYCEMGRTAGVLFELSAVARASTRDILPFLGQRAAAGKGPVGLAFSPTGRGLLTGAIGPDTEFGQGDIRSLDWLFRGAKRASGLRVRDRLAEIGARLGKTPAQVAIAWVLAQPGVRVALTGPSRAEHLEENVGAVGWEFPGPELSDLEAFLTAEDQRIRAESLVAAEDIMARPLRQEADGAYQDLIFAMETAVELGKVAEADVIGLITTMIKVRRETGGRYDPRLEELREELGRLVGGAARVRLEPSQAGGV